MNKTNLTKAKSNLIRRCENCKAYDSTKDSKLRCGAFGTWSGVSFEDASGDCYCVYFERTSINNK